jgi:hypothetical protein
MLARGFGPGERVSATRRFGDVAARLVENGYEPVPLHWRQKRPCAGDGWQHYRFRESDLTQYTRAGTGILCGKVVGLDIDVRDPKLVEELEALAEQMFGPAPRRVGQAPKVLRMLRAAEPFVKLATRGYRLQGDGPEDKAHKVEILAQGQQFVAYNVHPDTGEKLLSEHGRPAGKFTQADEARAHEPCYWR